MTIILDGKIVSAHIQKNLISYFSPIQYRNCYLAIFMLGDDHPGSVYVKLKHKFAQEIGLGCRIYGSSHLGGNGVEYDTDTLIQEIVGLNHDPKCLGIIVQQPLSGDLKSDKAKILSMIHPKKDCDGLGGVLFGLDSIDRIDFVPATPGAVINLLKYYQLHDMRGKGVTILGQSNLIGKPLAMYCIKQGATVLSCNSKSPLEIVKTMCRHSDYIFCATGVIHMIDETYLSPKQDQIIVDIGRGLQDGKAVGDVNWKSCVDKCGYLAKVPGGVGPVTVATLFDNIRILQELEHTVGFSPIIG